MLGKVRNPVSPLELSPAQMEAEEGDFGCVVLPVLCCAAVLLRPPVDVMLTCRIPLPK